MISKNELLAIAWIISLHGDYTKKKRIKYEYTSSSCIAHEDVIRYYFLIRGAISYK